ncbi:hypothetical protein ABOM_011030 [Aspergillus bombycis]|uniref:Zn(2)-C6 fungal-type domain-containing protein n=1 Tax=Aspergillus bombycis TaxID=109264 RepID=A0A1F7ZMR6_9EURO|nr:hypothetical protein ABOM_011030 [Aspergillus bombycis]OGM40724.1 hypothetical protein ABOM_011030 [Aspergillus bombycis]
MKVACVQCRVRKVRCDATVPRCRTCERLGFQCSFQRDGSQPVGQSVPRLPAKRRGTKACLECRTMKRAIKTGAQSRREEYSDGDSEGGFHGGAIY